MKSNKDNHFLMYYLNWFNYTNYVSGTTRLKLTQQKLKTIPFPIISYDKQIKISNEISYQFELLNKIKEQLK